MKVIGVSSFYRVDPSLLRHTFLLGPARFTALRISALVGRLERNSWDFNIRVVGVAEQDGEDCLLIIRDYLTLLAFEDDLGEIENAHRTGRKREEKPRNIIVKFHSRPFKRVLLRVDKNQENKKALNGVRFVEAFTPYDFEIRKKKHSRSWKRHVQEESFS